MIKFKHFLVLSITAALAANASAASSIQFSGSITTPTCVVKVQEQLTLDTVSTQSFTQTVDSKKVSSSKDFVLNVVDESDAICQSVSYASSNATGNTSIHPLIKISSQNGFTEEGYLKNSANTDETEPTLALLITDAEGNKIDLNTPNLASVDDETGAITLKAYYVALAEKVAVQQFTGSLNFTVDYK